MEFIQHAINWVRGEIFESVVFGVFGFITLIISIAFWKFGKTPNAKGMIIPLLVIDYFSKERAVGYHYEIVKFLHK